MRHRPRSSLGTAIAGTILVSSAATVHPYAIAMGVLAFIGLFGLVVAFLLPSNPAPPG
jgi:hypothetical protein